MRHDNMMVVVHLYTKRRVRKSHKKRSDKPTEPSVRVSRFKNNIGKQVWPLWTIWIMDGAFHIFF